jgi:hypothetical protein
LKDNLGAKMSIPNLKIIKRPEQVITFSIGLLFLLTFAPALYAATYYVDATLGNDTNDGLLQTTPRKTITKENTATFHPGDQRFYRFLL